MASLLSDAEKAALESVMSDLHDTFKRALVIFKDGEQTVISTDPNYNFAYGFNNGISTNVEFTPIQQTFSGRVLYGKPDATMLSNPSIDAQLRLEMMNSTVRIKLDQDGRDFLVDAKRVEFDGNRFKVLGDPRPHGLFAPQFYTFFLVPIDEQ